MNASGNNNCESDNNLAGLDSPSTPLFWIFFLDPSRRLSILEAQPWTVLALYVLALDEVTERNP